MFKPNISMLQRVLRFALGFFLLTWAVAGGELWGYSGAFLMATGAWGFCPIKSAFRRREYRIYDEL
jgi:hypothetical protein